MLLVLLTLLCTVMVCSVMVCTVFGGPHKAVEALRAAGSPSREKALPAVATTKSLAEREHAAFGPSWRPEGIGEHGADCVVCHPPETLRALDANGTRTYANPVSGAVTIRASEVQLMALLTPDESGHVVVPHWMHSGRRAQPAPSPGKINYRHPER